jgi:starch synthase (maltosyl-transferring)
MLPIVYNLFPTLAGPVDRWVEHARRAADMGFDWLYVNPVHYPGFSGSLYATKDYDRLHPDIASAAGDDIETLAPVLADIRQLGLSVMMDLVINHTSKDNPLVTRHPLWFRRDESGAVVSPSAMDPADARKITVWGDLAEVDNEASPDRDGLWTFWEDLVRRSIDLGFTGFRCDAAYKVPSALWRRLASAARGRAPGALFVAETLGCTLDEVRALHAAGFDYIYNSSKWWDFEEPWCLAQHEAFRVVAPSIAFPESHDTPRLAAESGGSEAIQRQRYCFAVAFSAGVQMPVGYELGFQDPLDVVKTRPWDWEDGLFDLRGFIRRVNDLKRRHPLLTTEGVLRALPSPPEVTVLRRWSDDAGTHRGLILVNRSPARRGDVQVAAAELGTRPRLYRPCDDEAPVAGEPVPSVVSLAPAEVALIME